MYWLNFSAYANLHAERGSPDRLDRLSFGCRAASRMKSIYTTFRVFQPTMSWLKSVAPMNLHAERGSPDRLAPTRVEQVFQGVESFLLATDSCSGAAPRCACGLCM